MGWGAVVYEENGKELWRRYDGELSGEGNTNNKAEYRGLLLGLNWLLQKEFQYKPIRVLGDSQLVVRQMLGHWRIKGGAYKEEALAAKMLLHQFSAVTLVWQPRRNNTIADQLSKAGIALALRKGMM